MIDIEQQFIEHSAGGFYTLEREHVYWLIEQFEKAAKYRKALEFYADENNWIVYEGTVETVPGEIARKVLEVMEK